MGTYFNNIGHPIPIQTNPAEYLLDIVSSDFANSKVLAGERVQAIQQAWAESNEANSIARQISQRLSSAEKAAKEYDVEDIARPGALSITMALLHRSFIKSYRDVVAYGIRIFMYLGMAIIQFPGLQWLIRYRVGYHDGYGVASTPSVARIHPTVYQCDCEYTCAPDNKQYQFADMRSFSALLSCPSWL